MDKSLVTTGFDFQGYRIVKYLGLTQGLIVRSRGVAGNIGAGFQALFGGNITLYTSLCEKSRAEACALMIEHADKLGANAIIGMRYDTNEVAGAINEVLAYGTAVVVEKIS